MLGIFTQGVARVPHMTGDRPIAMQPIAIG
jgi:hypothetical protein